ncbi:MAG: divergent polysaccharide deacetylase family protein [Nautiliaceae bacterium]
MKKKLKKNKELDKLKVIIYSLIGIIFILSGVLIYLIFSKTTYEKKLTKTQNNIKTLQEKISSLENSLNTKIPSEILDYQKTTNNTKVIMPPPIKPVKTSSKPKLVIIIDDVSFAYQVKLIKSIPFKITPSFFPPTKRHPNTPLYAKEFNHYMIHLPMEAIHFNRPEPKTLHINDSFKTILDRIKEVKAYFPNAKFLNNHTGSTFTADKKAMIKLFRALKIEHIGFVDSKTTPHSKSKIVNQIYHIPLYSRNIFLDNEKKPSYIRNQLKKAVRIAKKRGYAIAIGHPHTITLKTLKNSQDILKNIKVVYIDELN